MASSAMDNGEGPPASRIVGYKIGRKVSQSEIPPTIAAKARDVVGLLGPGRGQYLIPPGIDLFELGLVVRAGQFVLIPHNADNEPLWDETIDLVVSIEQAAAQRKINMRFYNALLARLPHDADDLEAGVESDYMDGERHAVFDLLRQAAVEIWPRERRVSAPLDDSERDRLDAAVASRAKAQLCETPSCRLDRRSIRAIVETHQGCWWECILQSVAVGDYEDATARVLARISMRRNLKMPMSCILQVLPGVSRLDMFFAMLGQATEHPVSPLNDWLERGLIGADPTSAELILRVLYAIWRMEKNADAARSMMRNHVERVQCEPISTDARLIQRWLATASVFEGRVLVVEEDDPLFDGMEEALERWERALLTTVDEIIMSLPERALDAPRTQAG